MNSNQRYCDTAGPDSEAALLERALEEYHDAVDSKEYFDLEVFLANYPTIADKLNRCIQSLGIIKQLTPKPNLAPHSEEPRFTTLGDFRIVRELGRGGMGIVYEAEQISLTRRVALKVLPFAATLGSNNLQRFKNEARAAAMLKHSNIVSVFSVGCERGVHYIAMELIEGCSLAAYVDASLSNEFKPSGNADGSGGNSRAQSPTVVDEGAGTTKWTRRHYHHFAQRAAEIADALQFAHQTGIVHRDIKPSNLLVDREGSVHVSDFGLAQIQTDSELTLTGDLLGTLRYMSPEQISGTGVVDHRTDVYSLGLTLYELLAKHPAHRESNRNKLARLILEEHPQSLRLVDDTIPRDLETIVFRAISKDREDRYQTCQDFADDLRSFAGNRPIRARRPSRLRRAWKWTIRNPWVATCLAAAFLILFVGVASTSWQLRRAVAAERNSLDELYGAEMQLAFDAWHRGDLNEVETKLHRFRDNNEFGQIRSVEWAFLSRQLDRLSSNSTIQCGGPVRRLAVSPDGSQIVSATKSRVASWRISSRQEQWSVDDPTYPFIVAFATDGRRVAINRQEGLAICDASTGAVLSQIDPRGRNIWQATFATSPNRNDEELIVVASDPRGTSSDLYRWNPVDKGLETVELESSPDKIRAMAISPDASQAALFHGDYSVRLYDAQSWKETSHLGQHLGRVRQLAFSDDGRMLISCPGRVLGRDSRVRFWDTTTKQESFPLPSSESLGRDVEVSPDSRLAVVYGGGPGVFSIWDLSSQRSVRVLGHRGEVLSAVWTADGKTLLTGGEDGTVRFWDTEKLSPKPQAKLPAHAVAMALRDDQVYVANKNFDDESAPAEITRFTLVESDSVGEHENFVTSRPAAMGLAIVDESTLVSCNRENVQFWNRESRQVIAALHDDDEKIYSSTVAASPDGNTVAIGRFYPRRPSPIEIACRVDGIWRLTRTLEMPRWPISLCFSSDGKKLAAGAWNGAISLWNAEDWSKLDDLTGHNGEVWSLCFTRNGETLASASSDRTVRLWDLQSMHCKSALNHFHEVLSVAFCANDQRLISGSEQGWLSFWNPDREQLLGRFQIGDYSVGAIGVAGDGSKVITASVDGAVESFSVREASNSED